jgi:hypothetical protein
MMEVFKQCKTLKGGSFSTTEVVESISGEKRVRKSISKSENREYGLVRWQSQIRRMQHLHTLLPNNTPPILEMGVCEGGFYYDIPFYESSQNLYDYLSDQGKPEASNIFGKVVDLIGLYTKVDYGSVVGSFSVFFSEEVKGRLSQALIQLDSAHSSGSISEKELDYVTSVVRETLPILDEVISNTAKVSLHETLTHGNFTLENALYLHDSDSVVLIDPYSETYSESVLGDYSQLMQSSVSFYEGVVAGGEDDISKLFKNSLSNQMTGVSYFGEYLQEHIATFEPMDQELIALFHGAQFIRMFPFKIGNTPRLAIYFLLHGLQIIRDTGCNAKYK